MKKSTKSTLVAAVGLAIGGVNFAANAALTSSATLNFNAGVTSCVSGDCANYGTNVAVGSWFGMDANGSGTIQAGEKTAIAQHNGIHIGFTSTASGSHSGAPFGAGNSYTGTNYVQTGMTASGNPIFLLDGNGNKVVMTTTENPGVDEPWGFFGNTGMDYLTTAVTVVNDAGSVKYLDFSGWTVTWNGIPAIPMNASPWGAGTGYFGGGVGIAKISCSTSTCSGTSTYTLDYFATVPAGDPSGFGGVKYTLHLVGTTLDAPAAVPVPAAVWLFGSGLMGMAAVARRKKKA